MKRPAWKALHEVIFKQARERIELAHTKAVQQGLLNPVVLALDLQDGIARKIADTSGRAQRTDEVVAEARRRRVTPFGRRLQPDAHPSADADQRNILRPIRFNPGRPGMTRWPFSSRRMIVHALN